MNTLKPIRLKQLKLQATFLFKEIKLGSLTAAQRFLIIPFHTDKSADWVLHHADKIKLKQAFWVIALEYGFKTWATLKHYVIQNDCLYRSSLVPFVHAWFKNLQQAELYHQQNGGYLLTFWKDFIVCGDEYIASLELLQFKELWKTIGYNWANPKDKIAWEMLNKKAIANYINQQ